MILFIKVLVALAMLRFNYFLIQPELINCLSVTDLKEDKKYMIFYLIIMIMAIILCILSDYFNSEDKYKLSLFFAVLGFLTGFFGIFSFLSL